MIWINNTIREDDESFLPFSETLLYAHGCFTTGRFENGHLLFMPQHLDRLQTTCAYMGIPYPEYSIPTAIRELCAVNGLTSARIKIIVLEKEPVGDVVITASELPAPRSSVTITMSDIQREDEELCRYKTCDHMTNLLSLEQARQKGFNDILFTDRQNTLLETAIANIYFISGNSIITPPDSLPILNGIVRKELLLHGEFGIYTVTEKIIDIKDIPTYEGAFITNALRLIEPVSQIDDIHFNTAPSSDLYSAVLDHLYRAAREHEGE